MIKHNSGKPIKIAVAGDHQVGKTSLVIALANESFPDLCPPVVPPASLPADLTPEGVSFHVIDTSSQPEQRSSFEHTCTTADVVVLLFEAGSRKSLKRIGSHWMPQLKSLGVNVPVIVVSSKLDLSQVDNDELSPVAEEIMRVHTQIETYLECSAKQLYGVIDVFHHAVKAVLHPVAPLFDAQGDMGEGRLRPLCVRALKRIFVMNDLDKDGALSDSELNVFQVHCFSAPLQPEELSGVKRVVSEQMRQGVTQAGLTFVGFLFLHALFIERGRLDTVWQVLRKYGYDESLHLTDEVLSELNFSHQPDQVVEMSETCRKYFSRIFLEFDKDRDQLLSLAEQNDMFSTAPEEPWQGEEYRKLLVSCQGRSDGSLTLQGFLAKWAYTTATKPVETLAYLRYLGYRGSAASMFTISRPRRQERKQEQIQRSVLQVHVVLERGTGQGLLLRGIAGKPEAVNSSTASGKTTAAGEFAHEGLEKTLIIREQGKESISRLEGQAEALSAIDVAAFPFASSSPDSFRQAKETMLRAAEASGNSLPCVLIAVESEGGMSEGLVAECGEACGSLSLRQPITLYQDDLADVNEVFGALLQAAEKPEKALAIPMTPTLKASRKRQEKMKLSALYIAGGVGAGLLLYAAYKAFSSSASPETGRADAVVVQQASISTNGNS